MLEEAMPVFLFLARAGFKSKRGEIQPSSMVFAFLLISLLLLLLLWNSSCLFSVLNNNMRLRH